MVTFFPFAMFGGTVFCWFCFRGRFVLSMSFLGIGTTALLTVVFAGGVAACQKRAGISLFAQANA